MGRRILLACLCLSLIGLYRFPSIFPVAGPDAGTPAHAGTPAALSEKAANVVGAVPLRVAGTEVVGQVTGRNSPNHTAARWDVHGTDLGHMFWHKDKLHMVFGDTFGPGGLNGRNWRSNAMARIADPDPRKGLPFEVMITGPNGTAKELIPSLKIDGREKTVIPTYGISLGARMYLHYMSVRRWGDHGTWDVGHSGIAYSDDDGQTWVTPAEAVWPQDIGFEQVAFLLNEGMLYSFGIPEGRFGDVRLRRVAPERILVLNAYEYWDGNRWVADPSVAATIVPAPVGELSVAWSETHQRWLMMYLDSKRKAVMLRTAPRLTGPWDAAQVVVTANDHPGLYAPYIVPGSDIDAHLYYTMSRWDLYNVLLMRTTLESTATASAATPGPAPGGSRPGNGIIPIAGGN